MAIGDVVYTFFLAVMHCSDGELRFDPSLTYPVPTGAFMTPVTMTPNGLVAVMSLDEQNELLEAPTANGVRISRIVSTMHELETLLAAPDYGADVPTRTEEAFYRMLRGITAANPINYEE